MKALVKYAKGPGNMQIRDVPEPKPRPGQVIIQVKATGICGSDLHIMHDDIVISVNPPVIIGHEFSGVIAKVGEGVTGWNIGDFVVSELGFDVCGTCYNCLAGFPNLCSLRKSIGYWYDGGFTSFVSVPFSGLHLLPRNVSFTEGTLTEPLACCVHGVLELAHITTRDIVLILGPGTIGLMALQLAKAQGATVIVCGKSSDSYRLDVARKLGADHALDIERIDPVKKVLELSDGQGADVVFECSGKEMAVATGFLAIRKRGQFTQLGLMGSSIAADFDMIVSKELRIVGAFGSRRSSWNLALKLMADGLVQLGPLVSHVLPISSWEKAFELAEEQEGLKIVMTPEHVK